MEQNQKRCCVTALTVMEVMTVISYATMLVRATTLWEYVTAALMVCEDLHVKTLAVQAGMCPALVMVAAIQSPGSVLAILVGKEMAVIS